MPLCFLCFLETTDSSECDAAPYLRGTLCYSLLSTVVTTSFCSLFNDETGTYKAGMGGGTSS